MEEKNNLWIVSELFPPDESSTAYILGEIANAMVCKYNVKVICGPEIYDIHKKLDSHNPFVLDKSIEVFRVRGVSQDKNTKKGKLLSFLLISMRLYTLAKKKVAKDDKVLMVTNPATLIVLMSILKRKCGFEWDVLVHDIFPENTHAAGIRLPFYGLFKKLFDRAYSRADLLIALGRDMKNVLASKIARYNTKTQIKIIENWADTVNIKPQPMPEGSIILEYAGNIGRVQGLEDVIEHLPDNVQLHMYGTGAMEGLLKDKHKMNVYFHGPYYRSQQNEVLAACHIALVTLQGTMYGLGVPSKTYNILASGRPILFLGPKDSEIDLLIKENNIGYCDWPKDWNKEELQTMGDRARALAEREYSKEMILGKFVSVL